MFNLKKEVERILSKLEAGQSQIDPKKDIFVSRMPKEQK